MRPWLALLWMVLALAGCQGAGFPMPIEGSTYRIEDDIKDPKSELRLNIFTSGVECAKAEIDEIDLCKPMVDRAAGEVHLSFQFVDRETPQAYPLALTADQIAIAHDQATQSKYELIPHDPRSGGQLFVVILDGSSSMYDNGGERIQKVYKALMSKSVADSFFPDANAKTGVMLLQFNTELRQLGGGEPKIIRSKKVYRQLVREHLLTPSGGYTHLYGAIRTGMTDLMQTKTVKTFLQVGQAQPTFIVLTDGFNNQAASDTCGDNASRLRRTLEAVKTARGKANGVYKPILYTVGLGRRYRIGDKPEGLNISVSPSSLCGRFAGERIDGDLERDGIDHVSLAWLAEAGGGVSFVKQSYKGLAEVFLTAAAKRYRWFELRYRVPDPLYHRKSFDVRFRLLQGYRAQTEVKIRPHPWLDAPTGEILPGDRWTSVTPLRHSLTILMPILGFLVFFNFVGAATFNARRAVFRRAKPRRRK